MKIFPLRYRLIVIVVFLCCSVSVWAEWMPFIIHYGKADYGNGATTWRIASNGNWTFFSNQRGLLAFDGVTWTRYELNNRSEARGVAVFPDRHRVFVGGENEYGYFEVGKTGALEYNCLSEKVDSRYAQIGNIFEIYELNGSYYLRGDNNILIQAGDKLSLIKTKDKIFSSLLYNGVIYVATDHGVRMVAGKQLVPIANGEMLEGKRINNMFGFEKGMIVTTATDGLFFYDGRRVIPYETPADNLLQKGVICYAAYRNGIMAFGTLHNGLVIYNTITGSVQNYDELRGLQSNTVISVAFDDQGNVWAGLDYGIDYVLLEDPFTYLYRTPFSYGIGYSALLNDQLLYLGTDRGVYYTQFPVAFHNGQPDIKRVVNTPSGSAWYLYKHENEVLCLHDKGIFSIKGDKATRITDLQGAWACLPVINNSDDLLIGLYSGIAKIRRQGDSWRSIGMIEGISEPCRYIKQTGAHTLKVYNIGLGTATEYLLDEQLQKVKSRHSLKESFYNVNDSNVHKLFSDWDISGNILYIGSKEIIPYDKGFVMIDNDKQSPSSVKLEIRRMYLTYPKDSLVFSSNFCNIKNEPRISYSHNSVRFEFQMPKHWLTSAAKFQYRLNQGKWSEPTENAVKEFSGLKEGKYTFEVKTVGADGKILSDSITFRILPPWYRTWLAYLVYLLMALMIIWFLIRLDKRRVQRKELMAVEEKNKEVDQMKIEISQLEKDKMELDIKHKSQEIANLMVNVARKNEVLTELRNDIRDVAVKLDRTNSADCKRQLLLINNRIDSNMEGDEVLKRFEEQFDLVNNNFMERLRKLHPDLNQNERLMCAYLKMDLTTKEIAPLLNISVRGVETIRYRLRKKFDLRRENNLTDYLNNL